MIYDVLIKNGRIVDGTENPWFISDIGIHNSKIVKIGKRLKNADIIIDASNLIVSPGFIDIHSHADMSLPFEPHQDSMIRQGITTAVTGNCGFSLAPINDASIHLMQEEVKSFTPKGASIEFNWRSFDQYLTYIEKAGCIFNVAPLVGFGTIRIAGGPAFQDRIPTIEEYTKMKSYIKEAMEAGAIGMSTGLIYAPQIFAQTQEIVKLAKVVAQYNGLYFSHIRNESSGVIDAVQELIKIVDQSGCVGGHIGHHKISGKYNWGASKDTLTLISLAYSKGLNITCDQYPYNRGMTSLVTLLPPWAHIGGLNKTLEHLASENNRKRMKKDMIQGLKEIKGWENWFKNIGSSNIYISSVKTNKWKDIEGKSLAEVTKIKNFNDDYETLFNILLEEKAEVNMTIETMGDEDIERIMTNRFTMIGTDGWGVRSGGIFDYGKPHPRFYGTYPRVLGKYVREKKLLSLEEAIRKMSSFPAQKLGLHDRGLLREGSFADVVIFDPFTILDQATFDNPHRFPRGVYYVLVNGQIVVNNEEITNKLPGMVLRKGDDISY